MKNRTSHYVIVYSILALALVLSLLPTNAQRPTDNDLVCSSIRVVNDKGELCAALLGSNDGGFLALYDAKKDKPRIMLNVTDQGHGAFSMLDSNGELRYLFNITNKSSILSVAADNTHKEDSLYIFADKNLGGYIMSFKDGESVMISK